VGEEIQRDVIRKKKKRTRNEESKRMSTKSQIDFSRIRLKKVSERDTCLKRTQNRRMTSEIKYENNEWMKK